MQINKLWVPVNFARVGSHILVYLVDPEQLELKFGFLSETLNELANNSTAKRIMSLESWLEETSEFNQNLSSIGKIFHTSRCGSTLLSQNLKDTKLFYVLGEPSFINKIYQQESIIEPSLKSQVAKRTLALWNCWAHKHEKKLVIKLTSISMTYKSQIIQDFPQSNYLFLFREPVAVIESLVRKPPDYINRMEWRGCLPNLPGNVNLHDSELGNYACKVYLQSLSEIHAEVNNGYEFCDYTNIANEFKKLVSYFLELTSGNLKVSWNEQWNSKKGKWKEVPYKPIGDEKLKQFYRQNKKQLDYLKEKYSLLMTQTSRKECHRAEIEMNINDMQ